MYSVSLFAVWDEQKLDFVKLKYGIFISKPISLVERCYCRSTVNTVPRNYIRELRFIHTPNCPFQVIAKLKSNKEVCVNPEIRWLQQYLKNALNKMKKTKQGN
uniref:Chemokine (C-X-C motif) ligand 12a (stromal cell-derived factor 1) n=1 Tax=Astatotilapia calliptera TaxID=8154 RepID=A0AAX7UVE3_ASTCA